AGSWAASVGGGKAGHFARAPRPGRGRYAVEDAAGRMPMVRFMPILVLALAWAWPVPAAATGAATIQEWEVPWPDTRPRDPSIAPDGRVWFVGQKGNFLAVFDPADARFERHDLPAGT